MISAVGLSAQTRVFFSNACCDVSDTGVARPAANDFELFSTLESPRESASEGLSIQIALTRPIALNQSSVTARPSSRLIGL